MTEKIDIQHCQKLVKKIRNLAIIAHVDHGKTTLIDKMLQQSGTLNRKDEKIDRIMDSNDQEKERGITITAKNTAINWQDHHINIIDTPGHADFGGEVERILSMVDSVLLLVDAVEGPMPQTRFVTKKAFDFHLHPIVVINKVDRDGADPDRVVGEIFDLFHNLNATEEQLDFPIIYASALRGVAGPEPDMLEKDLTPLFNMIINDISPPKVDISAPFQMQISALDYNNYVGVIGIGRITRGVLAPNTPVCLINRHKEQRRERVGQIMTYLGLDRIKADQAIAGDIICITGIDQLKISDTLCALDAPVPLPPLSPEEPMVAITMHINNSPFAGRDGKYLTFRNLKDRLEKELLYNVALRVEQGKNKDELIVAGRGELHLAVLIETMRREKFEMSISRPEVIIRDHHGVKEEPYENVFIDIDEKDQGVIMEQLGQRKAQLTDMQADGKQRIRIACIVPARSMIGFRSLFLTLTSGSGILTSTFDHYGPLEKNLTVKRKNGAMISNVQGKALGYALFNLQNRGRLFIKPSMEVYEGMVIGEHNQANDLVVNPTKAKQLTNIRAAGSDENIVLTPPVQFSLEQALDFISDDELIEITPTNLRIRKKILKEGERKRAGRS